MNFDLGQIKNLDQRYRSNLINCLSGFKSVNLVGTKDSAGNTNLAIMSQIFHLGADPALMGLIIRPASVPRHTYENILETGYYTFNHITPEMVKAAHQTSARYEKVESEFSTCGFMEEYLDDFHSPFVAESKIKIGLKLEDKINLTINETILLIGSVQVLFVPNCCLREDGFIDLQEAETVSSSGLDAYFTSNKLSRFSYAKPDKESQVISF